MNQFYITLPSDSSVKFYPDNTVAHFTTKLSQRLRLDGDYEVALCELIYPNYWENFKGLEQCIKISDYAGYRRNILTPLAFSFKSGYYQSTNDLLKYMNEHMSTASLGVVFNFNESIKKINLKVTSDDNGEVEMSDELKLLFGFDIEDTDPYGNGTHYAINTFDLNAGLRLMYIYSDVVSYSTVGDTCTPLLRVFSGVTDSHESMTRITFTQPYYIPVARRDIETIEININDELGRPMPFGFGKSVVILHFRRKNNLI